ATVARAPGCTVIGCLVTLPQMKSSAPPKAPCLGDGESGKRVQLFYGQVLGQADQSSNMIDQIRGAADAVNQAFRQAANQNGLWSYDCGPYVQPAGRMTACNDGQTLADEWDCGRDDYYNPDPSPSSDLATHWNLYHSAFLSPN